MAAKSMADYLSAKTANYGNIELDITPHRIMIEEGDKKQIVHEFDDGSVSVVSLSNQMYFNVTLEWDGLDDTDASAIMDLWHNQSKANGRANTFYWQHPLDGNTYTVRFMEKLIRTDTTSKPGYKEISSVILRVEGNKP